MSRPSWAIVALLAVVLAIDSPAPAQQAAPGTGRLAAREADRLCRQELAQLGPEEFAEIWGGDEPGADAVAECVADTLDSLLQPERQDEDGEDEAGEEEFV